MTLAEKVRATIADLALFSPCLPPPRPACLPITETDQADGRRQATSTVVVAVSGGPDSVCLLHLLLEILPGQIHAAHFNHSLRGAESDEDERFVRELASSLSIPITVERAHPAQSKIENRKSKIQVGEASSHDVAAKGRSYAGTSLEDAARRLRYRFLEDVASRIGALHVATGHTLDDQAETVLQRMLDGTGLRGLRGILPSRSISRGSPVSLNRPLIRVSRAEVEEYLSIHNIPFRTDSTNLDCRFRRNHIRHHVLPELEKHEPLVRYSLVRIATLAAHSYDCLRRIAEEKLPSVLSGSALECASLRLSIPALLSEDPAIQALILESLIERLLGQMPRLTSEHFERMLYLVRAGAPGQALTLPRGISLRKGHDLLSISLAEKTMVDPVQSPKSEVQSPKSKVQSPKSEVQSPKSEVQSPKSEAQSPKSEVQSPKSEVRSPKSEPARTPP